ncbi:uncharacterized protein N7515_008652 [Penicillium bovifimosum]|uniref:Uncharacterized protein n=1 Tax=Penicillium bovifimosum TaxID=126998 RepID=A0A9W9KXP4_9EURO|nr:uncharacterized protein N7515_008652 [Penicillium bovifimosum]KAJ5124827.1 hypothetical protein N7515_008652 [Penicillium bovifimosum]
MTDQSDRHAKSSRGHAQCTAAPKRVNGVIELASIRQFHQKQSRAAHTDTETPRPSIQGLQ